MIVVIKGLTNFSLGDSQMSFTNDITGARVHVTQESALSDQVYSVTVDHVSSIGNFLDYSMDSVPLKNIYMSFDHVKTNEEDNLTVNLYMTVDVNETPETMVFSGINNDVSFVNTSMIFDETAGTMQVKCLDCNDNGTSNMFL